jgi:hypothetical protein
MGPELGLQYYTIYKYLAIVYRVGLTPFFPFGLIESKGGRRVTGLRHVISLKNGYTPAGINQVGVGIRIKMFIIQLVTI